MNGKNLFLFLQAMAGPFATSWLKMTRLPNYPEIASIQVELMASMSAAAGQVVAQLETEDRERWERTRLDLGNHSADGVLARLRDLEERMQSVELQPLQPPAAGGRGG